MRYLLILLLTACASMDYRDTELTVHVMPDIDNICKQYGTFIACTHNNVVYLKGDEQLVTMSLSAGYIESLPTDCGYILADKLGLSLSFNAKTYLTHEFRRHVIGHGHAGHGTPHMMEGLL